ncbi:UNVERIFIED_CONTAM: hypothetical protein Sradi_7131600 [Sesamum radiatum]|uniref:Uncharacterized protein n=1 Tax=Sesamum radiatum TaxID=300843 RepID=A0AAW2IY73_SESRA
MEETPIYEYADCNFPPNNLVPVLRSSCIRTFPSPRSGMDSPNNPPPVPQGRRHSSSLQPPRRSTTPAGTVLLHVPLVSPYRQSIHTRFVLQGYTRAPTGGAHPKHARLVLARHFVKYC